LIELISCSEEIIKTVATAARVCYSGLPLEKLVDGFSEEENRKLIRKVTSMGHLSVVEHAVFTFSVPKSLKEELFEILKEKPFLNITEREKDFIVSLNLRTMKELQSLFSELTFTKEIAKHIPDWLA